MVCELANLLAAKVPVRGISWGLMTLPFDNVPSFLPKTAIKDVGILVHHSQACICVCEPCLLSSFCAVCFSNTEMRLFLPWVSRALLKRPVPISEQSACRQLLHCSNRSVPMGLLGYGTVQIVRAFLSSKCTTAEFPFLKVNHLGGVHTLAVCQFNPRLSGIVSHESPSSRSDGSPSVQLFIKSVGRTINFRVAFSIRRDGNARHRFRRRQSHPCQNRWSEIQKRVHVVNARWFFWAVSPFDDQWNTQPRIAQGPFESWERASVVAVEDHRGLFVQTIFFKLGQHLTYLMVKFL